MDLRIEDEGKRYWAITIGAPYDLALPTSRSPISCLLWDHEGRCTDAERSTIAASLVAAGCRYVVCGGEQCESWHDAVDMAFVREYVASDPLQGMEPVMTTWHEDESPDEVAHFFVFNACHGKEGFKDFLILHIGTGPAKQSLERGVEEYALNRKASRSLDA